MSYDQPIYNTKRIDKPEKSNEPNEYDIIAQYQQAGMGPFANQLVQDQDAWTTYSQLLQRNQLPQQYGTPVDPRSLLPHDALIADEEGRTTYQMPTVGKAPNTPYSQEVLDAYLRSEQTGNDFHQELSGPIDVSQWKHPIYNATVKEAQTFEEYQEEKMQNQIMGEWEDSFNLAQEDIERVQELGPENAKNLRNLATISLRFLTVEDDPEVQAMGQSILHLFKDYEPFHNIFDAETNNQTTFAHSYKPPKEPSGWKKAVGTIFKPLAAIGETGSWFRKLVIDANNGDWKSFSARLVRGGLNAAGELGDIMAYVAMPPLAVVKAAEVGLSKAGWAQGGGFLDKVVDPIASLAGNPIGSLTNQLEGAITNTGWISDKWNEHDKNEDGFLGFFETLGAFGVDENWGKDIGWKGLNAHNALEFAGLVLTDPITYATFGIGTMPKVAVKGMTMGLKSLSSTKGGVQALWTAKGVGEKAAIENAKRVTELVTRARNKQPLNLKAGDRTIMEDLYRFSMFGDEGIQTLARGRSIDDLLASATKKQNKRVARHVERINKRSGGGLFASYPSLFAPQKGIGMVDHLVPGTRRMYQWARRTGKTQDTWAATLRYLPHAKGLYTGSKAFQMVDTELKQVMGTLQSLRKQGAWKGDLARMEQQVGDLTNPATKADEAVREVTDLGLPSEWNIGDLQSVVAMSQDDAYRFVTTLEDVGLVSRKSLVDTQRAIRSENTLYEWVTDTGKVTTFAEADSRLMGIRQIFQKASDDGFEDLDQLMQVMNKGFEPEWAGNVDTVVQMGRVPRGAPETWVQRKNAWFMERKSVKALERGMNKFNTFHRAGQGELFSADEARAFSSMAVKSAQVQVETTRNILLRHFGKVKEALRRARPDWTDEVISETAGRMVNTYKSATIRPKTASALHNEWSTNPLDDAFFKEVQTFVKNLDSYSADWDEWLQMAKGKHYSSKDPKVFMPRQADPKTTAMISKWLKSGNKKGERVFEELTNVDNVTALLKESDVVMREALRNAGKGAAKQDRWIRGQAQGFVNFMQAQKGIARSSRATTKALMKEIPEERAIAAQLDPNLSGHLSARVFLPEVENVVEINAVIRDIIETAAVRHRAAGREFAVTNFYSVDPVEQWIRYARKNNDAILWNDLTLNLQKFKIFDDPAHSIVANPFAGAPKSKGKPPTKPRGDYGVPTPEGPPPPTPKPPASVAPKGAPKKAKPKAEPEAPRQVKSEAPQVAGEGTTFAAKGGAKQVKYLTDEITKVEEQAAAAYKAKGKPGKNNMPLIRLNERKAKLQKELRELVGQEQAEIVERGLEETVTGALAKGEVERLDELSRLEGNLAQITKQLDDKISEIKQSEIEKILDKHKGTVTLKNGKLVHVNKGRLAEDELAKINKQLKKNTDDAIAASKEPAEGGFGALKIIEEKKAAVARDIANNQSRKGKVLPKTFEADNITKRKRYITEYVDMTTKAKTYKQNLEREFLPHSLTKGLKLRDLSEMQLDLLNHFIRKARLALIDAFYGTKDALAQKGMAFHFADDRFKDQFGNVIGTGTLLNTDEIITGTAIRAADKTIREQKGAYARKSFPFVNHKGDPDPIVNMKSHVDYEIEIYKGGLGELEVTPLVKEALEAVDGRITGFDKVIKKLQDPEVPLDKALPTKSKPLVTRDSDALEKATLISEGAERQATAVKQRMIKADAGLEEAEEYLGGITARIGELKSIRSRLKKINEAFVSRFGTARAAPSMIYTKESIKRGELPRRGHIADQGFDEATLAKQLESPDDPAIREILDMRGPQPRIEDLKAPLPASDHQINIIRSGGQSGADRTGLEVGSELGIETGGLAPVDMYYKGRRIYPVMHEGEWYKQGADFKPDLAQKLTGDPDFVIKEFAVDFGQYFPEGSAWNVEKLAQTGRAVKLPTERGHRFVTFDPSLGSYKLTGNPHILGYRGRTPRNVIDSDGTLIIDLGAFETGALTRADWQKLIPRREWVRDGKNWLDEIAHEGSEFSGLYPASSGSFDTFRYARGEYVPTKWEFGARRAAAMSASDMSAPSGRLPRLGTGAAAEQAERASRPVLVLKDSSIESIDMLHRFLRKYNIKDLNVAGNRNIGANKIAVVKTTRELLETLNPKMVGKSVADRPIKVQAPKVVEPVRAQKRATGLPEVKHVEKAEVIEVGQGHKVRVKRATKPDDVSKAKWWNEWLENKWGGGAEWKGSRHHQAWFGDVEYKYIGATHPARPMADHPELVKLADQVGEAMGYPKGYFDSVLVNRYRSQGGKSIGDYDAQYGGKSKGLGAHSDAEEQFLLGTANGGHSPVVTLSLGGGKARVNFGKNAYENRPLKPEKFWYKDPKTGKAKPSFTGKMKEESGKVEVGNGDIYEMPGGKFQKDLLHQVDILNPEKSRLSFTFRRTKPYTGAGADELAGDAPIAYMPQKMRMTPKTAVLPEGAEQGKSAVQYIKEGERTSTIQRASFLNKNYGKEDIAVGKVIAMGDENDFVYVEITGVKKLKKGWTSDKDLLEEMSITEMTKPEKIHATVFPQKKVKGQRPEKLREPEPAYYIKFKKVEGDVVTKEALEDIRFEGSVKPVKQNVDQELYTKQLLANNRNKLYVFGDNAERKGMGGQAKAARNEKNSIGLRTKNSARTDEGAYWSDENFAKNKVMIDEDITAINQALRDGKYSGVVFPFHANGKLALGTGLAQLSKRAPRTYNYLEQQVNEFSEVLLGRGPAARTSGKQVKDMTEAEMITEWLGRGGDESQLRSPPINPKKQAWDLELDDLDTQLTQANADVAQIRNEAVERVNEKIAEIQQLRPTVFDDESGKYIVPEASQSQPIAGDPLQILRDAERLGVPLPKRMAGYGTQADELSMQYRQSLKGQDERLFTDLPATDDLISEADVLLNKTIEWYVNSFRKLPKAGSTEIKSVEHTGMGDKAAKVLRGEDPSLPTLNLSISMEKRFKPLSNLYYKEFDFQPKLFDEAFDSPIRFRSVEHAYQVLKTGKFNKRLHDAYLGNHNKLKGISPTHHKKYTPRSIGQSHKLWNIPKIEKDWNINLMEDIIRASLKQNDDMAKLLDETGQRPLTHVLNRPDKIWEKHIPDIFGRIRSERALEQAGRSAEEIGKQKSWMREAIDEGKTIGGGAPTWDDAFRPVDPHARAELAQRWAQAPKEGSMYIARPGAIDGVFEISDESSKFTYKSYRDGSIKQLDADNPDQLFTKINSDPELLNYTVHKVGGSSHAVLIDREITEMLVKDVIPRIKDGYMLEGMTGIMHQFNTAWSAYATVPLIAGIGFHARNHGGNWFNMVLAGFRNPKYITDAMKYQKMNRAVHDYQVEHFITDYNEATKLMAKAGVIKTLEAKRLRQLNHNAVLNGSFFKDLQYDRNIFLQGGRSQGSRRARKILTDNVVIRSGQKVGQAVEDNARIALFLDGIESKALSPFMAAQRVRDFLFDYGDLTSNELWIKNNLSRFYTFMRKNTELQARLLMESPGNTLNLQRGTQSLIHALLGPSEEWRETFVPSWMERPGQIIGAGGLVAGRFETPFVAALETVDRLMAIPALLPIIKDGMPEWARGHDPVTGKYDPMSRMKEVTQLLSGGVVSAVQWTAETQSGRNLFTGGMLDQSGNNEIIRFVNAGIPLTSKMVGVLERFGVIDAFEDKTGIDLGISIMADHQKINQDINTELTANERALYKAYSFFLGIDTYFLDGDQQMRLIGNFRTEWNKILNDLKEKGVDIPTMEEIRDYGAYSEADSFLTAQFYSADPVRALERGITSQARNVVVNEFGIDLAQTAKNAKTEEEKWDEVKATIQMVDAIINKDTAEGEPRKRLNDQSILNIALSHPSFGFGAETLENFHIEGFRKNMWDEKKPSEENLEESYAQMSVLFDKLGVNWEYAMKLRPRITEAERFWRDGVAAGYTTQQIFLEWIDDMSRQTKAELFGTETLDYWNLDKFTSKEKLDKLNKRLEEDVATATIASLIMGIRPTQEDIMYFLVYGKDRLTNSQRKALGLPIPKRVADREDPRTQNAINLDTLLKTEALQSSVPNSLMPAPASLMGT